MKSDVVCRNHVQVSGDGTQPMIFAHGYGCDQNMWRFITPAFEKDFKIVLFDHVGSGKSDISAYDYQKYDSLHGYADDVIEICTSLNLSSVIFVAHSVSCMIGILAANKRPDLFDKLILIGPSPCYVNDGEYFGGFERDDIHDLIATLESNYLGWSSSITPVIIGNPDKPKFSEELNNSFCQMDPEIAKHFAKVTFTSDNRRDLESVETPTLILQAHPDVIAPLQVGEFVHQKVKKSTLDVLKTSGHCPHLTAPKLVCESIENYMSTKY